MSNTLQLTDAYRHLVNAEVILCGRLRKPGILTMHYLEGDYEHTFARFTFSIAGQTTEFCFWEGMNETVVVEGNKMYLTDSSGDEVPLLLYTLQRIELE